MCAKRLRNRPRKVVEPANHPKHTNGRICIRVIGVIRGPFLPVSDTELALTFPLLATDMIPWKAVPVGTSPRQIENFPLPKQKSSPYCAAPI